MSGTGMRSQRFWVHQGQLELVTDVHLQSTDEEDNLFRSGSVRTTTGDLGTEIKWLINSPCVRSVFKVMEWIPNARPPYILRFYAMGWFEEIYHRPESAIRRLEQVLARGDRHFTSRIFIKEQSSTAPGVPEVLRDKLNGKPTASEFAVECSYDPDNHLFKVERVGAKSAIGQVWGTYTSSHPCQSAGSYGNTVNATYEDVIKTGKPRYDHVLAALRLPDNAIHWVPYHRVITPKDHASGKPGVEVVSQIARVDITVL
jgi:hypothetical protein